MINCLLGSHGNSGPWWYFKYILNEILNSINGYIYYIENLVE